MSIERPVNWFGVLLIAGYLLVPFMSLPLLPSDYRPVSVIAFAVTGAAVMLVRLIRRRMPWDEFLLGCFLLICGFQTLGLVAVMNADFGKAIRHLVVLFLGALSYVSLKLVFRRFGPDRALRWMVWVFALILVLGVVEVLCILHVFPWSIKVALNNLLGGRSVGRVQLVTSEASWGAKVLLFGIPLFIFYLVRERKCRYLIALIVAAVLFCFTLSMDGFLAAGLAVLFFGLVRYRDLLNHPKWCVVLVGVLLGLAGLFYGAYRAFPKGQSYFLARLHTLETLNVDRIRRLPQSDGSVFIRLYYPWLGVRMFLENPLGLGLGGYSQSFPAFLDRVSVDYSRFPEVMGDLRTQTGDPKSLYAKILAENGTYSGWVLLLFAAIHLYYLKLSNTYEIIPYRNLVVAWLAVNGAVFLQFGSFAYLPMWFTLALNAELIRWRPVPAESG